jgi:hypothetical protein
MGHLLDFVTPLFDYATQLGYAVLNAGRIPGRGSVTGAIGVAST